MNIAIFGRYIENSWHEKVDFFIRSLAEKGANLFYYQCFADLLSQYITLPEGGLFTCHEDLPSGIDIFLSLGGDGTLLQSLSLIRDREIPVAGINFGRLGFLTTAKVEDGENSWIDDLINRRYKIESRALLQLDMPDIPEDIYPISLNEISISRKDSQMLSIELSIDGYSVPAYWADGLMVATPTGSTAYSLSVGGPIVIPGSKVFIIAPIAPHNLNIRPIVVPNESVIEIVVRTRGEGAILTIDNRSFDIRPDTRAVIKKAGFSLRYFTIGSKGFMAALNEKLLWGEDKRN